MRALVSGLLVLLLTGCGKHYWNKTGAGYTEFAQDHRACTSDSALQATPTREYGVVSMALLEDEELVKLDAVPPQEWEQK